MLPCNPALILFGSSWRVRTSRLAPVVEKHRIGRVGRRCMLRKHRHALVILPSSDCLVFYRRLAAVRRSKLVDKRKLVCHVLITSQIRPDVMRQRLHSQRLHITSILCFHHRHFVTSNTQTTSAPSRNTGTCFNLNRNISLYQLSISCSTR